MRAQVSVFIFICFCGYIAFVLRSTAIPAVRITVRTLYSKLTCSYIYVSQLGRVGHIYYAHTAVYWYGYTRYDTSAVVALYVFVKITDWLVYRESEHMQTVTRSAEKCRPILLWTAWWLSFDGTQYAQSFEEIQYARVLVSCISIRLVRKFSLRYLFLLMFSS